MQTRRHKTVFNPSVEDQHLEETEKSQEHMLLIYEALAKLSLTRELPRQVHEQMARVVKMVEFADECTIIRQGEQGDRFYILVQGHCDVIRSGKKVNECKPGQAFGELSLLFNQPRAASVITTERSVCYYLTSEHFKVFLMQARKAQIERYRAFLHKMPVLQSLSDQEIYMIAQAMRPYAVKADTCIVTQGEVGDLFYFIECGSVEVIFNQKKVAELKAGSYFGEQALLHDKPRNATVRSIEPVECAVIDRETFRNLIGNLQARLEEGRQNE